MQTNVKRGGGKIAINNFFRNILSLVFITSAVACTDEVETAQSGDDVPLALSVNIQNPLSIGSRAIVDGTTLPDGSQFGVSLKTNAGTDYDNKGYTNVLYTVSGSQCTSDTEVMLSMAEAKVYSYHPYNEDVTDITRIPVSIAADVAEQDDYMYGIYSSGIVSKIAPNVSFTMKHVLAGIKVSIKKTSDATDYSASKITVKSGGMAKSGYMNAMNGSLNDLVGAGDEFSQNVSLDLTTEYQSTDVFYFLPTGKNATLRFVVTVDGTDYVVVSSAIQLQQGTVYEYKLNFDNQNIDAAMGLGVAAVTAYAGSSQNGGNLYPRTPSHGEVFAVSEDGDLISADFADETCIAAALVVGNHQFWIAKDQVQAKWPSSNNSGITDYSFTGGGSTGSSGYLLKPNWTYQSSPYLSADYTTWTTGALSDFNGKANSAELEKTTTDGYIGKALVDFKADETKNLGKSDWYVPALGQLALIYMNMNELNTVLTAIGGTALESDGFWSGSEGDSGYAWGVGFSGGLVGYDDRGNGYRVRFVRDI